MTPVHERETTSAVLAPRRKPVQARSRARVDRILDAAARLFAEKGYSAVKTNHIARRAGVSIGSVYQFFPNRFAIFDALAERYRSAIAEVLAAHIGPGAPERSWEDAIDGTINALARIWREEWSFFAVWSAIDNVQELRGPDDEFKDRQMAENLLPFYRRVLPNTPEGKRIRIAGIIFEMFRLCLDSSMQHGDTQDAEMVDELQILVKSYLRSRIAADAESKAG